MVNFESMVLRQTVISMVLKQTAKKRNTYLQIKQLHDLPSYFIIDFLNFVKVRALFTSSVRVLHSILPINKREYFFLSLKCHDASISRNIDLV